MLKPSGFYLRRPVLTTRPEDIQKMLGSTDVPYARMCQVLHSYADFLVYQEEPHIYRIELRIPNGRVFVDRAETSDLAIACVVVRVAREMWSMVSPEQYDVTDLLQDTTKYNWYSFGK